MTAADVFEIVGTTQAGVYLVEDVVAEGGFAVVYRAHHEAFRAKLALKCLKLPETLSATQQQRFLERFREEGELQFRLSSEVASVVRPLHVGALDSPTGKFVPFMALEWLEGESLEEMIEGRSRRGQEPLGLKACVRLLAPVAHALRVAHRFPTPNGEVCILHRDLKPGNIFVTQVQGQPSCKILDFGLGTMRSSAAQTAAEHSLNHSGVVAFTPSYGAPEQWLPQRFGPTGPWTDVWGLALTMVGVVSGHAPLRGDATAIVGTVLDPERRPTPRNEGVRVSDEVEWVFDKALAIEPADRYPTVDQFWRDLLQAASLSASYLSLLPPVQDHRIDGNLSPGGVAGPIEQGGDPGVLPGQPSARTTDSGLHQTLPAANERVVAENETPAPTHRVAVNEDSAVRGGAVAGSVMSEMAAAERRTGVLDGAPRTCPPTQLAVSRSPGVQNGRTSGRVRLVHADRDVALGHGPDVFLVVWRDQITVAGVRAIRSAFSAFARDCPEQIALVTVLESGAILPSSAAREELAAWMRSAGERVVIAALVYGRTGFLAASVRSVVTSITVRARQSYPHRVFRELDEAAAWVEERTSGGEKTFSKDYLKSLVLDFRRLVD